MKIFLFTFLVLIANVTFAANPTVKITSFYYDSAHSRLAEICGKVDGMTSKSALVRITVDETTKNPGVYHSTVESDGLFCLTVISANGTAIAEVPSLSINTSATTAK